MPVIFCVDSLSKSKEYMKLSSSMGGKLLGKLPTGDIEARFQPKHKFPPGIDLKCIRIFQNV